jgi:2-haloacid dehalogenase
MMYVSPSTGREIKAVLFDTFGTVVDWRSGVARNVTDFARRHRIDLDTAGFAEAWRAKYEPSMEPIRNGVGSSCRWTSCIWRTSTQPSPNSA